MTHSDVSGHLLDGERTIRPEDVTALAVEPTYFARWLDMSPGRI
jgi:hypothetical protein